MRRLLGVALLFGCNNAFDLQQTILVDAAPDSPPIDAPLPPLCPAIGEEPKFGDDLRQIPAPNCEAYMTANQAATGRCSQEHARGEMDMPLTTVKLDGELQYAQIPRLAPDGEHLFVEYYDMANGYYAIADLQWTGENYLKLESFKASPSAQFVEFSGPSRGPDRRLFFVDFDPFGNTNALFEMGNGSGTWKEVRRYPLTEVATTLSSLDRIFHMSLSADGLRLVYKQDGQWKTDSATNTSYYADPVWYTDRASLDEKFRPAIPLSTVPDGVQWPYLTEDCGRIYFTALNRVFYLKQPPRG